LIFFIAQKIYTAKSTPSDPAAVALVQRAVADLSQSLSVTADQIALVEFHVNVKGRTGWPVRPFLINFQ